jgi:hypothetical protein
LPCPTYPRRFGGANPALARLCLEKTRSFPTTLLGLDISSFVLGIFEQESDESFV